VTTPTPPTRRRRPRPAPQPASDARAFPPPTEHSEDLIETNLGLARQAAWRWSRRTGQPYDDLEAIAFVGLIRGCRRYDPQRINPANGKPYALSTIVCPFVNGEILHWFRDRGHAVRYPSKWREAWGKVQRLLDDPDTPADQVAQQAGLSQAELDEMLASMTGTISLDDTLGLDGAPAPEPEDVDRLSPLQATVADAWCHLHPADQGLLLAWWQKPRRLAYPLGPIEQFHRRFKRLLQGRSPSEYQQLALLHIDAVPIERQRAPRRNRKQLQDAAVQLGFLA
jgi:hypothetical protein